MTKLIFLDSLKDIDYSKVGLKCGLEIHQQLNTGKLFCNCPCEIVPNSVLDKQVERELRFSLGETGDADKAAIEEFKKGKFNIYKFNDEIACLVDLDEEPPQGPNSEAMKTAIGISLLLNMNLFSKVQYMRKLIVDGSITSGFQRTAMLGIEGHLKSSSGEIVIEGINLEEDSSRIIEKNDNHNIFSLDRQGLPLIEITTGPNMNNPIQVQEVALELGNILRSFKQTRRGIGTIRQDLNVSISKGARVEIKGAQNLKLIPEIINDEIKRQLILSSIIDELKERKIDTKNFSDKKIYDLTKLFSKSESKVIIENLKSKNGFVGAIKLVNFKGILKHQIQKEYRFATEVSNKNKKHYPQVKGLFHLDELPNYGITQKEVDNIKSELKLDKNDSFILICNDKKIVESSLTNVLNIISELITEVPSEVRQVDPKGTITNFLRPMPGSARMYPETDIPDFELNRDYINSIKKELPELIDKKINRLTKSWEIEKLKVTDFLEKFSEEEVKEMIKISGKNANTIYNLIFEIPKDIKKRENIEPIDFKISLLNDILKQKDFNSQTIRDLFISLYKDKLSEVNNLQNYIESKGLVVEKIDTKEIEKKVKEIISNNKGAPFGALMGHCMKEFSGKVDGKILSDILKKLLN